MPIVVLAWVVAALLLAHALYGPDRWYYAVSAQVRPGATKPSPRGRRLLVLRNWLLVAAAVAVAVPLTLDRLPPSDDDLAGAVEESVAVLSPVGLTQEQLAAELGDRLDTEVSVYLYADGSGDRTIEPGVPLPDRWEVRLGPRTDDTGYTAACVAVETTYVESSDLEVVETTGVEAGACG